MVNCTNNDIVIGCKGLIPEKQTPGAAGYDIRYNGSAVVLKPREVQLLSTGIYLEIPYGYEGQIRSRSGLSYKKGLVVVNSPGTIDSDYRGEIKVILGNISGGDRVVNPGDRIAQLVINRLPIVRFQSIDSLSDTTRGDGGFGSTGEK